MKNFKFCFLVLPFLFDMYGTLQAAQLVNAKYVPLFNNHTYNQSLSYKDINRLTVRGDKLTTEYCPPNDCKIDHDPNDPSGSIYVSLTSTDPFTFFLGTENHRHFALQVTPKAVPGKTIIFDPVDGGSEAQPSWAKNDYEALLVNLTKAMMNNTPLEGFGYQPIMGKKYRLPTCMRATLQEVGRYNGDQLIGSVQQYCNLGKTSLTLSPNNFYQHDIRSVAIGTQTLAPKQCGFIYEILSREA